jgi:murein DD-endopeptidase MepM/ murein hydrolase activator NlpD
MSDARAGVKAVARTAAAIAALILSLGGLAACSDGGTDRADDTATTDADRPAVRPDEETTPTEEAADLMGATNGAPTTTAPPVTTADEPAATARVPTPYVFPVDPTSAADYSSTHHDYPATDIFVPVGTRYVAVTDGVVDFVSTEDRWDPAVDEPSTRGGISVAIVGDDGVRYYGSHLSSLAEGIAPGARVTAGQLLGLSGKTGNAAGTAPHVHFGISHPTTPDDWQVRRGELPPYQLLEAWKAGRLLAPDLSSL